MMKTLMNRLFYKPDRILKPLPAALFLGLVVVTSLIWFKKGVHVSGVFAALCANHESQVITTSDALFCSLNAPLEDRTWLCWMAGGIFLGALVTSFFRNRMFKLSIERGSRVEANKRLLYACAGGIVVGIGAAIAGGCTSSVGLTGASLLTIAGFAFLVAFFIGGFVARAGFARMWR